jgi:hypothetical protein
MPVSFDNIGIAILIAVVFNGLSFILPSSIFALNTFLNRVSKLKVVPF